MHPCFLGLAASVVCCAAAAAADPADYDLPTNIRVAIQFVEIPHPLLTELMAGPDTRGHILHQQVMARVAKGEAKIIESGLVVAKSAGKAKLETIGEMIYPTEFEPPSFGGGVQWSPPSKPGPRPWGDTPSAWDTRNTGFTFEIEPNIREDGIIELKILPEIVTPVRMDTWMEFCDRWGDASIRMPVFRTLRVDVSLSLLDGRFDLAGVLTPKPAAAVPAVLSKVLVFVRADIIRLHPNP